MSDDIRDVLAAIRPRVHAVEVREFGGRTLHVRGLTVGEWKKYSEAETPYFDEMIVAWCLCDESGNPLYPDGLPDNFPKPAVHELVVAIGSATGGHFDDVKKS